MTTQTLRFELELPQPRDRIFPFFADARNLQAITPPWLCFAIVTPGPIEMKRGAIIDYRLKVHRFPLRWRTEITLWEPPFQFEDTQRRGPYRLWVHRHEFEERAGKTLVIDQINFAAWGGKLIQRLFVTGDVRRIFAYRQEKLRKLFGA